MTPTSFGIAIPQIDLGPDAARRIVGFTRRAEEAGFGALWTQEDTLRAKGTLEPLSLLAFAAASSDRARLGVAVVVAPLHVPVQLAKVTATVDVLSDGRLILGVGIGSGDAPHSAYGIDTADRARRFENVVDLVRELWSGEPVRHVSDDFRVDGQAMTPTPVQRPRPPIWFGGHSAAALQRAARLGDGFIGAGASSTIEFARHVSIVRGLVAQRAGGTRPFDIAKRVYIACDNDGRRAQQRLETWLRWYYDDAAVAERVGIAGDVADCVAGLQSVLDAGAGHVILNFVFDEETSLERAVTDILPQLDAPMSR